MTKYIFETEKPEIIQITSEITILKVTTIENIKEFYKIPRAIYQKDLQWVAPFWNDLRDFYKISNPFWNHAEAQLYIAYHKTKPVGRIAAIIDHDFIKIYNNKTGYFGFFECIDNTKIALSLFSQAEAWLKSKGVSQMQGPINGHIDLGCGFLMEGFKYNPSMISMHTPKYYLNFMKDYKMEKLKDLVSYRIDLVKPIPKQVQEISNQCLEEGINIRRIKRLQFNKEMKRWYKLFVPIFEKCWGYVPVSYEEMMQRNGLKQLRWIMNPRLFLFAEKKGETIGFRISLPDFNPIFRELNGKLSPYNVLYFLLKKHTLSKGKFIVMGINKDFQGKCIGTCLNYHTLVEMKKLGYKTAEYGWIEEDNIASCKAGEKIGGQLYKKHRIFSKKI
jgi:hypothetical protein